MLSARIVRGVGLPLLSVFTAVIIGGIFIILAGYDPIAAYLGLLDGAFGDAASLTRTLVKMTPLVFSAWRWPLASRAVCSILACRAS
jgi:simple sugar transport system permease protein